jgi:pyrroline-5-carboxylate reductase
VGINGPFHHQRGIDLNYKFGIIGGGVMGEAILSRLLEQHIYRPEDVIVSEPQPDRQHYLAQTYGVQLTSVNEQVKGVSEVILLAVKPQSLPSVVESLSNPSGSSSVTFISILAGVTLLQLEAAFPGFPMIRAMPNTPAVVGAGITAIAEGSLVQTQHRELAQQLFQAIGDVVTVPESLMDAVTALAGSGPGFIAVFSESLIDGGVAVGLPRSIATQLAIQTLLGTAQLLKQQSLHPAELKDRVTSPGGTTIHGIAELERAGLRSAVIEAIRAAAARSRELGHTS